MPVRSKSTSYAALLRGVNLGSHNRIGMGDLRALVEGLGYTEVRTYVQSGNVVFRSDRGAGDVGSAIQAAVRKAAGLDVAVVIRSERQLKRLAANNPFAHPQTEQKALHVTFLAAKPDPKRVRELRAESYGSEQFQLVGEDVYLFVPGGYGRSKLNNALLERRLGVAATTRNWRTVTALAELTAAD